MQADEAATFNGPAICVQGLSVEGNLSVTEGEAAFSGAVHGSFGTTGPVMQMTNTSADPRATAVKAVGVIALDAHGKSSFSDHMALAADKRLALDGATAQNYVTYNSTEERMEFYIGGILRFVIDETGGHNP